MRDFPAVFDSVNGSWLNTDGGDRFLDFFCSAGSLNYGHNNDVTGLYEPDDNFTYIHCGWEMMIEGYTRNEIVKYWNEHNAHRMTKLTRKNKHIRRIDITENMTTKIFHDPFYYGLLVQGGRVMMWKPYDSLPF